ncbi:MAG: hypothetical protein UD103_01340 [Bacteroidales bacterium]|nr:hypothetical protein [Bacteroidales bacterium]
MFKAVDWIVYLLVLAVFIITWITDGFWLGLLAGIVGSVVAVFLFGMGGGTEVKRFGHTYTLTCSECGYEDLEITEHTEVGVVTRCRRCGKVDNYVLRH